MRIERHGNLTPALAELITSFVAAEEGDAGEVLGEAKRARLVPGTPDWSGVLALDDGPDDAGGAPGATTHGSGDTQLPPGRLAGYAHVRWEAAGSEPRASAEVVVDRGRVDRLDVAAALLDEVRALVAEAGGGVVYVWAHRVRDPDATFPAAAGFRIQRRLAVMQRPLLARPEVGDPPEGVALRTYRPNADDAELIRVNNAAFADHPEQGGWDAQVLADRRSWDWFDPAGVITAWQGGRLLGFHWTKIHDGAEPTGEVYVLGVGPDAQGMGLGGILLDTGLAYLYDRGCRRVILYVDLANTGAVRLYETAGFETEHLEVCYEDLIRPAS